MAQATAPLVSPATARSTYGSATTHTEGVAAWSTTPPEIKALARSLGAEERAASQMTDAQYRKNVLEWVRNNIETEFRYGLSKGGRGALIDQYGSPFDQAELVALLLREGGLDATYINGDITVSAQQFGHWTGVANNVSAAPAPTSDPYSEFAPQAFTVDAKSACRLLADGAIPATVNGSTDCDTVSGTLSGNAVTMSHIWVQSGGETLDPSYKMHILEPGIDLQQAMGCGTRANSTCGADTDALLSGSTSAAYGATGATKLTFADGAAQNVQNAIVARAKSLFSHIRANEPDADVTSVVGGQRIAPSAAAASWGSAGISYSASGPSWSGKVPDQYRTRLTVSAYSRGGCTFFADELAGRRLGLTGFDGEGAMFILDNRDINGDCHGATQPVMGNLRLTVDHPYVASGGQYGDRTVDFPMVEPLGWMFGQVDGSGDYFGNDAAFNESSILGSFPIFIVHGFGAAARSAEGQVSDLMAGDPIPNPDCRPSSQGQGILIVVRTCHIGNMPVLAESVRSNVTAVGRIVSGVSRVRQTQHDLIGLVYSSRGIGPVYLSTSYLASWTPVAAADTAAPRRALGVTSQLISEVENNSMIVDPYNPDENFGLRPGVPLAGSLFIVPPAAMSGFLAALPLDTTAMEPANFETSRRARLQGRADAGYTTIMSSEQTFYAGELFFKDGASARTLWAALKGAQAADPVKAAMTSVQVNRESKDKPHYGSVSLADGSLAFAETPDLVTGAGDFPSSLAFTRIYKGGVSERTITEITNLVTGEGHVNGNSTNTAMYTGPDQNSPLRIGGGWTHNFNITARVSFSMDRALGDSAAIDASQAIASAVTMNDTAAGTGASDALKTASAILGYFPLRSVMIQNGVKSDLFVWQVNGDYLARGNAGRVVLPPNFGGITYTASDGSVMTFATPRQRRNLNSCSGNRTPTDPLYNITSWQFPSGIRLDFSYQTRAFWPTIPEGIDACTVFVADVLTQVRNNLGRQLNFASAAYYGGYARFTQQLSNGGYTIGEAAIPIGYKISSVTDENGRAVTFSSDCATLLCNNFTITRPGNVQWQYSYAPTAASPDPALLVKAGYLMRSWIAPGQSVPREIFAYDDMLRVKTITDANGIVSKAYAGGVFGGELYKPSRMRNASGVSTEVYGGGGSKVRTVDPLGRVSRSVYDDGNRPIRAILPEGNETWSQYDRRGNVVQLTQKAKPGTSLSDIVRLKTYVGGPTLYPEDCVSMVTCNDIATETDALGNVTSYSWNSTHGGLLSITGPAVAGGQPLTTIDYSAFSSGGSSFYLPTTVTQLISAGNSVATTYGYDGTNKFVLKEAVVDAGGLNLRTCFLYDATGNLISKTDPNGTGSGC